MKQPGIAFDQLPLIDAILLTNNHYDHLNLPCIGRLWKHDHAVIYTPLGTTTSYGRLSQKS